MSLERDLIEVPHAEQENQPFLGREEGLPSLTQQFGTPH